MKRSDKEIVAELSKVMTKSIIELVELCIEQRLTQMLPLIKQGIQKKEGLR